jgi:alkanesulfonate monooxygenase SsuD/methylene tetrahydromethanopterin reductase-like flavin-dependent oxidoreductase (luciferase family)
VSGRRHPQAGRLAVKLSTTPRYAEDVKARLDQVVAYDGAGLDIVWIPEAYGFDSPTLMGYLAAGTQNVRIGPGILNVYSRAPTLLAQTAARVGTACRTSSHSTVLARPLTSYVRLCAAR